MKSSLNQLLNLVAIMAFMSLMIVMVIAQAHAGSNTGAILTPSKTEIVQRMIYEDWEPADINRLVECDLRYRFCDGGTPKPYTDGIFSHGAGEGDNQAVATAPVDRTRTPDPSPPECR